AAFVPDRVRDAESAEPVDEPGAVQHLYLPVWQVQALARGCGEVGDTDGVPEEVRRLEIDEVPDRAEGSIEALVGQRDRERGLGVDDRAPRIDGVEISQEHVGLLADDVGELRVEL